MNRLRLILGIGLAGVIFVFFLGAAAYTDWLWFRSLGYANVFVVSWSYRLGVGLVAGAVTFLFLSINAWLAGKLAPGTHQISYRLDLERLLQNFREQVKPYFSLIIYGLIAAAAVLGGLSMAGFWSSWLTYLSYVATGVKDPLFGNDVSFYFFSLPVFEIVQAYALVLLTLALGMAVFIHLFNGSFSFGMKIRSVNPRARIHLSVLAGLLLAVFSVQWWLAGFHLLYSSRGAVYGAGYTDVNILLPAYRLLVVLGLVTALVLALTGWLNRWYLPVVGLTAMGIVWVVGVVVLPAGVQQYRVSPNEIPRERQYIAQNIKFTRKAFGLDKVRRESFPAETNLTQEMLEKNSATIEGLRLWDWRALKKTYSQIQEIRLYYLFGDVDLDRYTLDGKYRQIALSAREMSVDQLPEAARTWVNRHLVYTHGYGFVASPVNEVAGEGLPELIVKNIPPKTTAGLEVTRPEIYFGESSDDYAVVGTKTREFDYPAGDKNKYTAYKGAAGVSLSSYLTKMAFAYRFGTVKLLLSDALTPQSRVLLHRSVKDRLTTLAPFLTYDADPYMVVSGGKLYWIVDAYTMSDRYPYSKPVAGRQNYMKNSVKAVIDAYEGTVDFYIADRSDSIIKTYARAYPGLFKPLVKMDKGLLEHIRYPEALFTVQAEAYSAFHMNDPQVFYNKEDLWDVPKELYDSQQTTMDPYYVIMRLPGEERPEFVLILPFTPTNKNNMIAWLAARSDPPNYGQLVLQTFPKDKLIYGPLQIEARLDQEPEISRQLSLWNQRGSRVIRGNLLVVPVEDSVLFVEPIYLQAEASELPELKRVAVGLGDKVVMEPTLEEALAKIVGVKPATAAPTAPREKGAAKEQKTDKDLIDKAATAFDRAEEAQRDGDWAQYGRQIEILKEALEQLSESPE